MTDEGLGRWVKLRTSVERRVVNALIGTGWIRSFFGRARREPVDGRTLAMDVAAMLGLDDLDGRSDLRGLSPPEARAAVAGSIRVVGGIAEPGVSHEDREVQGPAGAIGIRVYTPDGLAAGSPGLIYLHGGGWVTGSVATHDQLCRIIARGVPCRVASVEYRLAPEHRYPVAAEDCLAATRWVLAHAEELGMDPSRVAVAGDSAGGNLSAVVSRRTQGDARRLALQVLLYPALDATCSLPSHTTFAEGYFLTRPMCEWYYGHYLNGQDPCAQDASPLLAPDVSDVPALIYTSGFDPLRDEGKAYADRLRAAGTPVTYHEIADTVHGFALMTGALASARATLDGVIGEIRARL